MTEQLDRPETVMPTDKDVALAAEASRKLSPRTSGDLTVQLDDGQVLTLPRAAARLLSHLLTEMGRGNAVTLIPVHAELTTQEAADLLNVSRPHLIRMLEAGELPHHLVGTHRRVRFADLEAYRARREVEREERMQELADQAQELGMGY